MERNIHSVSARANALFNYQARPSAAAHEQTVLSLALNVQLPHFGGKTIPAARHGYDVRLIVCLFPHLPRHRHAHFYVRARLGLLVRCGFVLVTFVLTRGFSFARVVRALVQALLSFPFSMPCCGALRVGYSFSMFDTGLKGFTVPPTVSLRGGYVHARDPQRRQE
jgi:hypothetical protein